MVLQLKNVSKKYNNEKIALENFSIEFKPGIYGILGPNGAGKSTLMNIITDNISRTSGEVLYDGKDILELKEKFRSKLGFMPQQQGFYEDFSPYTFLRYIAELKGIHKKPAKKDILKFLEKVNLSDVAYKKIRSFSGGMKQRVLLAQALLGDPEILILDEPTAGLDPKERISIRNLISELSKDKIIILATHVVNDIECIADYVLLIKDGKLIKSNSPSELIESVEGHVFETVCTKDTINELKAKNKINNIVYKNQVLTLRTINKSKPEGFKDVNDINLEDVYLYYFEYLS